MRKKISNALQCRRSTFKRPGEINPLTHDDPWALSSDIEHLKKRKKKYYLWVKNRLPLSRSIRTSPNDLSHQSVFVYQDRRAAIISLNFFSFYRY